MYALPLYFLPIAIATAFARLKRVDRLLAAVIGVAVVLMAGTRFYCDVDFEPYVEMFDDVPELDGFSIESTWDLYGETGYLLLSSLFKTLGFGFTAVALLCAFLSVTTKLIVVRWHARNVALATVLYLCIHFLTIEFIQMRWAVATGFVALGLHYSRNEWTWKSTASFAAALAFHWFAIIYVPIALLVARVKDTRTFLKVAVGGITVAFLAYQYLAVDWSAVDSELYVVKRAARYLSDPTSELGVWSYAKLMLYGVLYLTVRTIRRSGQQDESKGDDFLLKVAAATVVLTISVSFVPMLHYRAVVLADFFAIMLVLNEIDLLRHGWLRTCCLLGLGALYAVWYLLDWGNYANAGRISAYASWLTA